MNRNIEIKAHLPDYDTTVEKVVALADEGPIEIPQEDTFFPCPQSRLKLRRFSDHDGELISYDRPSSMEPSESRYLISRTSEPASLREVLEHALGTRGVVRKHRTLYLIGQTRVHLDDVDGLGTFIELEVVLRPGQEPDEGIAIARDLMNALGIEKHHLIEKAYIDMLDD